MLGMFVVMQVMQVKRGLKLCRPVSWTRKSHILCLSLLDIGFCGVVNKLYADLNDTAEILSFISHNDC